ncbi:MAG: helix-turn-helix domain-containing protein [Anaeroplasmataceae bacterium]|nr:helix-turn-helix domain-containing protein [Anaeroplasmataceae bacterium]
MKELNEEILKENAQIGEFIRVNRMRKNILTKNLADILDVSPVAISNWERGEKLPTIERAAMLSQLFGITLDDFYSCNYSIDMLESVTKLQEYVFKRDAFAFDKLDHKTQREIIREFILALKQFNIYVSSFLNDEEIDEKKFEKISSLLCTYFCNTNEIISPYYVIYKIDNDFDVEDFFNSQSKSLFLSYIDDSHFSISLQNGKNDVLFLTTLKEKDKEFISNYEESLLEVASEHEPHIKMEIYDSNGNAALFTSYGFDGKLTSRMMKEFRLICKIRGIDSTILYDNILFDYINDFTNYLFKKENIELLKGILLEIPKEYKNEYLCLSMDSKKKDIKLLYELLMSGATFDDSNKTISLLKDICKALYKNESYIK